MAVDDRRNVGTSKVLRLVRPALAAGSALLVLVGPPAMAALSFFHASFFVPSCDLPEKTRNQQLLAVWQRDFNLLAQHDKGEVREFLVDAAKDRRDLAKSQYQEVISTIRSHEIRIVEFLKDKFPKADIDVLDIEKRLKQGKDVPDEVKRIQGNLFRVTVVPTGQFDAFGRPIFIFKFDVRGPFADKKLQKDAQMLADEINKRVDELIRDQKKARDDLEKKILKGRAGLNVHQRQELVALLKLHRKEQAHHCSPMHTTAAAGHAH